ncbi:hypothetical protein ACQ9BO_23660 [Flavobacterium sp. P21]|uniref:hypothetical protein n=1 Tax=Flavobacterium sp. P21 TaxID=3423948 RepID=UPI003D671026
MDNQDKIFDKFKEATENAPAQDFPGMEKVWSRVEQKLDKKEDKKTISLWKKIAVAASLLLVISLGYQFLKTDKKSTLETNDQVVTNDTQNQTIKNNSEEKNNAPASSDSQFIPNEEAEKILENKTKHKESVAIQETTGSGIQAESSLPICAGTQEVIVPVNEENTEDKGDDMLSKKKTIRKLDILVILKENLLKLLWPTNKRQKRKKVRH